MFNPNFVDTSPEILDESLLSYAESLGHGEIHIKLDKATGLRAIIAIHNINRGPALGGCRFIEYPNTQAAILDAVRLAQGMSYKSAISNLPHGGGKAVLIKPKHAIDREAYFQAFGRFVNDLSGRYITAVDSGTSTADMDIIARETSFVTSNTLPDGTTGDPSPSTATGVRRGIEAAVKFSYGRTELTDLHVAIQGVGHVGYHLAKELHERGAKLTICDTNHIAVQRCIDEFAAQSVDTQDIYQVKCDVYAPCALGATINDQTLNQLQAKIVAGSANNQLAESRHGQILKQRGILYAPDYVINAGGLIFAVAQYHKDDLSFVKHQIDYIYDTLMLIFAQSARDNVPTNEIADRIAAERLL